MQDSKVRAEIANAGAQGAPENTDQTVWEIEDGVLVKYNGPGGAVTIPAGIQKIGKYAFERCKYLTSVVIPDSVTAIGDHAFSTCMLLERVALPKSVVEIGERAFASCSGLINLYYQGTKEDWLKINKMIHWNLSMGARFGGYTYHFTDGDFNSLPGRLF